MIKGWGVESLWGSELGVGFKGLGCRDLGLGYRVCVGSGVRGSGLGSEVQGLGSKVWGIGFKVWGLRFGM